MIDELDEVLRQLLKRELPIKNGQVDIAFNQPRREWSAKLSRPTLNLFLYDIRENVKLRQAQPQWSIERNDMVATERRRPMRVELKYVITAWATEPEDEHRLLARTLMALFRFPHLPEELIPDSLRPQPAPISMEVAQPDGLPNPSDFWSAMDNEIRPALLCTISMALDPYQPATAPLVRERELHFVDATTGEIVLRKPVLWTVSGQVRGLPPMRPVKMTLVERAMDVPVEYDGSFNLKGIAEGEYTLKVLVAGREPVQHKLVVPSREYAIDV
jgi:hypothetical protein